MEGKNQATIVVSAHPEINLDLLKIDDCGPSRGADYSEVVRTVPAQLIVTKYLLRLPKKEAMQEFIER